MCVQPLGQEDPLEEEMATPSSIPAWDIPWTERLAGYFHGVSKTVRHVLATTTNTPIQNKKFLKMAMLYYHSCTLTLFFSF